MQARTLNRNLQADGTSFRLIIDLRTLRDLRCPLNATRSGSVLPTTEIAL